ncbi:MAG: hypothetical protein RR420_05440 [Anaerovoracaceae bacterium]
MIDTSGWSKDLLFNKIMGHQLKGIMIHNDLANLSGFYGLHNFQKWHMCRVQEETEDHLKTQSHYILYHEKMPVPDKPSIPSLIPHEAYSKRTREMTGDMRKKFVYEMMEKWKSWEEETIELHMAAVQFLEKYQCYDVFFFKKMLKDTYCEYKEVVKCMEKLRSQGHDIEEYDYEESKEKKHHSY